MKKEWFQSSKRKKTSRQKRSDKRSYIMLGATIGFCVFMVFLEVILGWSEKWSFKKRCETGQMLYYDRENWNDTRVIVMAPDDGEYGFWHANPKGDLKIPKKVLSENKEYKVVGIGPCAFAECDKLNSVSIPSTVVTIGDRAFYAASSLQNIHIPKSVTSVGADILTWTRWYLSQPDGLLYLDNWCLGYKGEKPTGVVTIKEGIVGIANDAFAECFEIDSVILPSTLRFIGQGAFMDCKNCGQIELPNSVRKIGARAFRNTRWYNNQTEDIIYLGNWCVGYRQSMKATQIVIKDGTVGVARNAFSDYEANADSLVLPASVLYK